METYVSEIGGDIMIVVADGGLNSSTASQLADSVQSLLKGGISKVILDCSRLEVLSSTGLASLLLLHHRMRKIGGDVKVAGLRGTLMQVVRISRLDRVFDCHADVSAARLAFRPPHASG